MVPVLVTICVGLIIIFALAFAALVGYAGFKLYRVLGNIEKSLKDLSGADKSVVALLEGITKVCESLVDASLKMNESVSSFQGQIFPASGSGREAFQAYTDASAGSAWKVEQMMRARGVGYEEAKARVGAGAEEGNFFVTE